MKKFEDEYMPGDLKWMRDMRQRGFCVVCFTPDELDGADPDKLEERLVDSAWDIIDDLKEEDDEE